MLENGQTRTDEELEEEAFLAAMKGDEVDAIAPAKNQQEQPEEADSQQDDAVDKVAQGDETKVERKEVFAGMTEEEIKEKLGLVDKLQRALDTTNGTYGQRLSALQQRIDELTQERQQKTELTTSQQKAAQLSAERFSRLRKEFPELTELLEQDIGEVLSSSQATPDLTQFKGEFQQQLDDERQALKKELQERELRLLRREHPDFNEVAGFYPDESGIIRWNNPGFGNWVASQPKEVQNKILSSEDAFELSDLITAYKKTLKHNKSQTNLERAIQPKGVPATRELSALDEEERAFRAEMARREY